MWDRYKLSKATRMAIAKGKIADSAEVYTRCHDLTITDLRQILLDIIKDLDDK